MGRIFTWQEIEYNLLPTPPEKVFPEAREYIESELERSNIVAGAMMYGSLTRQDWNARSDIDYLVVTMPDISSDALYQIVTNTYVQWHIEVAFEIIDINTARSGCHTIGPLFLQYLHSLRSRESIRNSPLDYIKPHHTSPENELRGYLALQERRLQTGMMLFKSYSLDDCRRYKHLRKVSECAMHIARKHLQYRGYTESFPRNELVQTYAQQFDKRAGDLLRRLIDIDDAYTHEIEKQIDCKDLDRYWQMCTQLFDATSDALKFVRMNWSFL